MAEYNPKDVKAFALQFALELAKMAHDSDTEKLVASASIIENYVVGDKSEEPEGS